MLTVVMVHGWGYNSESNWLPWLANALKQRGISVAAPDMPNTDAPKIEEWVPFLRGLIKETNEDLFLVGHSIGCQTILRYLEALPQKAKIGGVVFVAGWVTLTGLSEQEKAVSRLWETTPIDWQKVAAHAESFTAIYSDNDPYAPESNARLFNKKLNAKIVLDPGKGHFTKDEDGVTQLPSVLNELLALMGLPRNATPIWPQ